MPSTTTAELRAARAASNAAIAARDAVALAGFFVPEGRLIGSAGTMTVGAKSVRALFEARLADPSVSYVRTTRTIRLDQAARRAAESGRWRGSWREQGVEVRQSGPYLAVWTLAEGRWLIESELYFLEAEERAPPTPAAR